MKWWDRRELGPAMERMAVLAAAALVVWALWSWVDRALLPGADTGSAEAKAGESERAAAAVADTLKLVNDRGVFQPPKPKGFQLQLTGVAGREAIFTGGQKAGVGGDVGGAKVLAIGPDWAEIEFEGNQQKLYLFGQGGGPGAGPEGSGGAGGPGRSGSPGMRPDPAQMREMRDRARERRQ